MWTDTFFKRKRNVVFTAIFYTFLWGCAFPLVKLCMDAFEIGETDNMSKCLLAGIRFFFSGLLVLLICFLRDRRSIGVKIKHILLYGILSTSLQYSFTYIALSRIDGAKGAVFDQLCVFIIAATSGWFFPDDKLTWRKALGCLIGFLGIGLVNVEGLSLSFDVAGEGIMLCSVLCQTVSYFIAKNTAGAISASRLVGYGQLSGGILLCVFSLLSDGRLRCINSSAVLLLLALILISAIAYTLSLMPLKYFPASEVSSFNLLITVFGVGMSSAVLGENIFSWNYPAALILITAGILLINTRSAAAGRSAV